MTTTTTINTSHSQSEPSKHQNLDLLSDISTRIYNNDDPHNPQIYLDRARLYTELDFPDLAAADAYRVLMLLECVVEPEIAEYVARRRRRQQQEDGEEEEDFVDITYSEYESLIGETYLILVQSLARCGCLRDALDFRDRAVKHLSLLMEEQQQKQNEDNSENISNFDTIISQLKETKLPVQPEEGAALHPSQGSARRVLYPWNEHEPDRKSRETLSLLNQRLETVAPNLEIRAVALPALHEENHQHGDSSVGLQEEGVSVQLGLFAKMDLQPGEIVLRESSLLTATNRLHDDLCDACNGPLPSLSTGTSTIEDGDEATVAAPVACQECDDTIFCSQKCHDQAQETYHAAICGREGLESIGKDVADPNDKADYLYFLLLGRAIAMAATQDVHPLDLPEIKYIWGDFHDYLDQDNNNVDNDDNNSNKDATLPFSFQLTIVQPIRLLEEMGLDPFTTLNRHDTWILNTMYAKFRGTASGRLSTWDGGPEVCAVHPLWCLANHSCDPNVRWEWGGEICFVVRNQDERARWRRWGHGKGEEAEEVYNGNEKMNSIIRKDEQILNHYCDIGLDVKERRDWARGALGGECQCTRCRWEAGS